MIPRHSGDILVALDAAAVVDIFLGDTTTLGIFPVSEILPFGDESRLGSDSRLFLLSLVGSFWRPRGRETQSSRSKSHVTIRYLVPATWRNLYERYCEVWV